MIDIMVQSWVNINILLQVLNHTAHMYTIHMSQVTYKSQPHTEFNNMLKRKAQVLLRMAMF